MARTVDEIKDRCVIETDADGNEHWIWGGAKDVRDGQCVVRAPDYGRDKTGRLTWPMSVQRALYMITAKRAVPPTKQVFRDCDVEGCVRCYRVTSKKSSGKILSARMKGQPHLSEAALRTWDKRGRKVSDETVAQIIMDPRSHKEVAEQHGLRHETAWKYRTGRLRKHAANAALGPFAGMLR